MYSNSANGAANTWIVRTSTPKKMKVYDFDPGPSTSFDPIVDLPSFNFGGQSSAKPKRRKGSIIDMICEAIEVVGSATKGASYMAIYKWICNNRKKGHTKSLRTFIRKALLNGLKNGLLKRSSVSKTAVGVQGYFVINTKHCTHKSRNSAVIPKIKITKNVDKAKPNKAKIVKKIQTSHEDPVPQDPAPQDPAPQDPPSQEPTPQSVLASILKVKEAFEETAQSILQQASKVLDVATKLIEASNSRALNTVSEQNTNETNSDVEMLCVVQGEVHIASMQSVQSDARVAPMQSVQGEVRVAPMQSVQGEVRVAPMQSVQGAALMDPMQSVQGEARVTPIQSVQGEVRVASMQSVQGDTQVAPVQLVEGKEDPVASLRFPLIEDQVDPMNPPSGEENRVVRPPEEELPLSRIQSKQIREAQVASVQPFQISEMQVVPKQDLQVVDSRANQCSSQEVNNTSRGELSDEELGEHPRLNFSSDSSFGVKAEVSDLIQHLGEQLK